MINKIGLLGLLLFVFVGCKKEIALPVSDITAEKEIVDHSSIYFEADYIDQEIVLKLNTNNIITSTNWVFTIDRNLPLELISDDLIALQIKHQKKGMHTNEDAKNYFIYYDKNTSDASFLDFTELTFSKKIKNTSSIFTVDHDNIQSQWESLKEMNHKGETDTLVLHFGRGVSSEEFIQTLLIINKFQPETFQNEVILQSVY